MVPGHPPCALCSLIFSSLDPETNFSVKISFLTPAGLPAGATGLYLNHFFAVQLSRCDARSSANPPPQLSRLHTVEIALFRRTSPLMKFPPLAVISGSPLKTIQSETRQNLTAQMQRCSLSALTTLSVFCCLERMSTIRYRPRFELGCFHLRFTP